MIIIMVFGKKSPEFCTENKPVCRDTKGAGYFRVSIFFTFFSIIIFKIMYYKEFQHFFRSGFITALFLIFGYSMNAQEAGRQATPDKPVYKDIVVHRPPQREVPPVKPLPLPAQRSSIQEELPLPVPAVSSAQDVTPVTEKEDSFDLMEGNTRPAPVISTPRVRTINPNDVDIEKKQASPPSKMKISYAEFSKMSPEKQQFIRENANEIEIGE